MRKKLNMSDVRDLLVYKIENGTETDHEYELYLAIIESKINIKDTYGSLLKKLLKEIRTYEES